MICGWFPEICGALGGWSAERFVVYFDDTLPKSKRNRWGHPDVSHGVGGSSVSAGLVSKSCSPLKPPAFRIK